MVSPVLLEDVSCPLGCMKNDEIVLTGFDLIRNLPGVFNIVRCCNCGLMRTNPRPTPKSISLYYPDDYPPYVDTRVQHSNLKVSSLVETFLIPIARYFFRFNTMNLPKMLPGRMLEVGCASGAFLHKMKGNGWQVRGIEFSEKAAKNAAELGYPVYAGALDTAPKPDIAFDLIVGWMVLEHLHEPILGLRKLRDWAEPDAWLVLSVPNSGSFEFNLFKEKLYALHLPNHLFHFTPASLDKILSASGWKLEKIHHQRTLSNLIASIGHVLRDKGFVMLGQKLIDFPGQAGRWPYVLYPLAWLFSLFGQTGRMTVWARAKDIE